MNAPGRMFLQGATKERKIQTAALGAAAQAATELLGASSLGRLEAESRRKPREPAGELAFHPPIHQGCYPARNPRIYE